LSSLNIEIATGSFSVKTKNKKRLTGTGNLKNAHIPDIVVKFEKRRQ
jgi:hypothetical protein